MNIIKTGSKILTIGNHFMQFNKVPIFASAQYPITQAQGAFNFAVANEPLGIAIDPPSVAFPNGRIFVCNIGNSTVSILNYTTPAAGSPTVITTLQGTFSNPSAIAIDPPSVAFPNGRIFVTNFGNHTVSILNYSNPTAGSPTVITTAQGTFNQPSGIAIDPINNRIFVVNQNSGNISILNYTTPTSGSPTMIPSGQIQTARPGHIAIDPSGNRIFVASFFSSFTVLDYTNPVTGSSSLVSVPQAGSVGIALDIPNNRIFVASSSGTGFVYNFNYTNPSSGTYGTITYTQGTFSGCAGIAIDAIGNRIFIPNYGNNTVSILTNQFS